MWNYLLIAYPSTYRVDKHAELREKPCPPGCCCGCCLLRKAEGQNGADYFVHGRLRQGVIIATTCSAGYCVNNRIDNRLAVAACACYSFNDFVGYFKNVYAIASSGGSTRPCVRLAENAASPCDAVDPVNNAGGRRIDRRRTARRASEQLTQP